MKVICTRCGGTNIACEAIVNPNTGKIIDYLDESFMHANCGDCKEEVVITDVDRVKKDIDSMFSKHNISTSFGCHLNRDYAK